jgi:hypothetical protein
MDTYVKSYLDWEDTTVYYHYKDNYCVQQVVFRPNGVVDVYTEDNYSNERGFLTDQPLENDDPIYLKDVISKEEFCDAWYKATGEK